MRAIWSLAIAVAFAAAFPAVSGAQSAAPEHYKNTAPVNPDPNYTPGDYPAPDAEAAQNEFDRQAEELAPEGDVYYVVNEEEDEIAWTAVKNETASVLGYFRTFDGYVSIVDGNFKKAELLIDVNSLDSAVPGRDNRIKAIFFQSSRPEMGTARLALDKVAEGNPALASLEDGQPHPVVLSGTFTLGGITVPAAAKLQIEWSAEEEIFTVTTIEPLVLLVSDLKLDGNMPELMKECNHISMGNAVKITCKLRFE